ncbi:hypothetical protein TBH_C2691 [Thiolapillus brandeum]|uniref:SLH domain-containing protein n=1 Tax=Thiolapillus brandeum TaxID=1076588 RepID=A0A7U6GKZ7_9GAMM|nr:hypothetical protein TBH_C2691 [Thiolapillus brandeum]
MIPARIGHSAVWTGKEMLVWGGSDGSYGYRLSGGGRYDPVTDRWRPITPATPSARKGHTAVWTGNEMIVWGGNANGSNTNTGGRYDPATNSWSATDVTGAPSKRGKHTAVWTGKEMIIWGGEEREYGRKLNTGGRYNPAADSWSMISPLAPQQRADHTAVWTGTKMIVWGGIDDASLGTGGSYDPVTDEWQSINAQGAPEPRTEHTAVWTGTEMIVWGGEKDFYQRYDNGGRYDPVSNQWLPVSGPSPSARKGHTAVWTGTEMIIWGGGSDSTETSTGGRYDPSTDTWRATSTNLAPKARNGHTAVWTGREMIVWGGVNGSLLNDGGRYDPLLDVWRETNTINTPSARSAHTAVWTGREMIVWGGEWADVQVGVYYPDRLLYDDVSPGYWAYDAILALSDSGLSSGCGDGLFCPEGLVSRAEMSIFLEKGMNGATFVPPTATGAIFADVPAGYWAAAWIEKLYADGITGGCGGGNYCPEAAVDRAAMAVLLLRAEHGSGYVPPAASGSVFADVPTSHWAAPWIEQLASEGITSGCGGGNYCPDGLVTRAEMAIFLVRVFNL